MHHRTPTRTVGLEPMTAAAGQSEPSGKGRSNCKEAENEHRYHRLMGHTGLISCQALWHVQLQQGEPDLLEPQLVRALHVFGLGL